MISNSEREMLVGISGERARRYVAELVEPMNRTAGTKGEAGGAKRVQEMLAPFVDECELDAASVTAYVKREGQLEVVSPTRLTIPCEAAAMSGAGSGEAILWDVGHGTWEDYEKLGRAIKDAAVLVPSPPPVLGATYETRACSCLEAKNRGAKCFIFHVPGQNDELVPVFPLNVEFPSLIISNRSAMGLRKLVGQHKEVRIRFNSLLEHENANTYNVVGTILGSQYPKEVIYLTSHHDTWYYGANDNNAGTACLLEAARIFKKQRPRHTIKFVIFGSEESGGRAGAEGLHFLGGSYGYSDKHRAELERISGGYYTLCEINAEVLGYTPRVEIMCSPEMLPFSASVANDLGGYARTEEPLSTWFCSDHLCFHTLGIPSILIIPAVDLGTNKRSSFFEIYHTTRDNMDAIKPSALAMNSGLITLLVSRIDSVEIPPYALEFLIRVATRNLEHFTWTKS